MFMLFFFMIIAVTVGLFAGASYFIIRYLFSIRRLTAHLKENEPELWEKMASPENSSFMQRQGNPLTRIKERSSFLKWISKGGTGAQEQETLELIDQTKKSFRAALIAFGGMFIIYGLSFYVFFILMSTQA